MRARPVARVWQSHYGLCKHTPTPPSKSPLSHTRSSCACGQTSSQRMLLLFFGFSTIRCRPADAQHPPGQLTSTCAHYSNCSISPCLFTGLPPAGRPINSVQAPAYERRSLFSLLRCFCFTFTSRRSVAFAEPRTLRESASGNEGNCGASKQRYQLFSGLLGSHLIPSASETSTGTTGRFGGVIRQGPAERRRRRLPAPVHGLE